MSSTPALCRRMIQWSKSKIVLRYACSMLHAPCSVLHAPCSALRAPCSVLHAPCSAHAHAKKEKMNRDTCSPKISSYTSGSHELLPQTSLPRKTQQCLLSKNLEPPSGVASTKHS